MVNIFGVLHLATRHFFAIMKLRVGITLPLISKGGITMHNKPVHRSLTLRIAIFTLALWLAAMVLLTWIVAADMQRQLRDDANDHVALYTQRDAVSGDTSQRPLSLKLLEQLGYPYVNLRFDKLLPFALPHTDAISSTDPLWGNWKTVYGFEAAEIFSESETGSIVAKTDNFATFQ